MRSLALLPCLLLAACGSVSGGGAPTAGGDTTGGGTGGRAVPGGEIAVQQTASTAFRLNTTVPGVDAAEVLTGDDYASAQAVALTRDGDGWRGSAAPGSPLLVRLALTDGSVIESAPGDFALR